MNGPEIAAGTNQKCIIVATQEFSQHISSRMNDPELPAMIRRMQNSVHLIFCVQEDASGNCWHDALFVVNLTQPVKPALPHFVALAVSRVCAQPGFQRASCVQLSHYNGGLRQEGELMCCIVFGGDACGWTVTIDLEEAIQLAHRRADCRHGTVCGGQTVRITGLHAEPELNGELGIAVQFNEENGLWLVRLWTGEVKQLMPINLEGME
jgi:hypothetical protein